MTRNQYLVILAVILLGWWAYRNARRARMAAQNHVDRVNAANSMVGIAATIISYI